MERGRNELALCSLVVMALVLFAGCGGGDGSKLTETDLFTRMIGYYQVSRTYYTNGSPTGSWSGCDSLEPYNTWSMFFEDMDTDTNDPDFLDSSLIYSSDSVRYEWSWEEAPGTACTEFQEYVFGGQGATFSYESEEACGDTTWREEADGIRMGANDTPNDAIREAIPLEFDSMVNVTLDPGDMDFFTFTIDETMTVEGHFENFTGTISGLNHDLYYGERWMPSGGWSGSTPSQDAIQTWNDLDPNTYYLILYAAECDQAGTFELTLRQKI